MPCLNDEPTWIAALAALAAQHLQGWPTQAVPDPDDLAQQRRLALALGAAN